VKAPEVASSFDVEGAGSSTDEGALALPSSASAVELDEPCDVALPGRSPTEGRLDKPAAGGGFCVGMDAKRRPFRPMVRSPSVNVPLFVKEKASFCSGTKRGGGFLRFVIVKSGPRWRSEQEQEARAPLLWRATRYASHSLHVQITITHQKIYRSEQAQKCGLKCEKCVYVVTEPCLQFLAGRKDPRGDPPEPKAAKSVKSKALLGVYTAHMLLCLTDTEKIVIITTVRVVLTEYPIVRQLSAHPCRIIASKF